MSNFNKASNFLKKKRYFPSNDNLNDHTKKVNQQNLLKREKKNLHWWQLTTEKNELKKQCNLAHESNLIFIGNKQQLKNNNPENKDDKQVEQEENGN